jgi:hypothetical protein
MQFEVMRKKIADDNEVRFSRVFPFSTISQASADSPFSSILPFYSHIPPTKCLLSTRSLCPGQQSSPMKSRLFLFPVRSALVRPVCTMQQFTRHPSQLTLDPQQHTTAMVPLSFLLYNLVNPRCRDLGVN